MDCKMEEKEGWQGKPVKVIGPCYEPGLPKGTIKWKKKLESREEYLGYLKQSERYWYQKNEEWYGSEKRKNPA